jgi:thymidylate kinase
MLIVLEGCDGTGKTTLANSLAAIMNAEVIHCSQYTPNDYFFFHQIIEASKTKNIVADRFMYGQFIYQEEEDRHLSGIGMDERYRSSLEHLHILEAELLAAGGKLVHVTAPDDEIKERLAARNELLINGLTVEDVQARFRGTFKLSMLPIVTWNTGRYQFD